jgi:cytoskeletal protein CcmA (bactofilin family)
LAASRSGEQEEDGKEPVHTLILAGAPSGPAFAGAGRVAAFRFASFYARELKLTGRVDIVRAGTLQNSTRIVTMAQENSPAHIGKTIVICGEVKGSEDLILDGRVEGTVNLAENRLTIGANANIAANLSAKDVLVLGRVQGNIVASGRVELRSGCNLQGDIRALRLAIEDNAVFHGKVDLTQGVSRPADAAPQTGNGSPGSGS